MDLIVSYKQGHTRCTMSAVGNDWRASLVKRNEASVFVGEGICNVHHLVLGPYTISEVV